ncbi:hypothetical protein N7499_011364 [Penicillium canescens]|nr:hypothetical protein N7499_011364 [Penicillium canescens]KAJ6182470.1 hypothetical protein N7485_001112 [Penicillium canescens]
MRSTWWKQSTNGAERSEKGCQFGGTVIGWVCNGTSKIYDGRAWKIPSGLFFIIPSIIISPNWFIPEFGSFSWSSTTDEIEEDFSLLQKGLEEEPEQGHFKELFSNANRKRTAIVQATGQAFTSQYGTLYVKPLQTINRFNFNVIMVSSDSPHCTQDSTLIHANLDRPLLLIGAAVQTAALMAMGALGEHTPNYTEKSTIVAMSSLFMIEFNIGWADLTYVMTTEIPALRLRDNSQRIASVANMLTFFVVASSMPCLMDSDYANLHSKVGFIYGSISVASVVFVYFRVPECHGR